MMKTVLTVAILIMATVAYSQENDAEHLLDGTSMNYYYQNGTGVHVEFASGELSYRWITGPNSGSEGTQPYMSRKVGNKMYLVNFVAGEASTFVTLLFNFTNNVMYSSVIFSPTTDDEMVMFEGGIIENLNLVER